MNFLTVPCLVDRLVDDIVIQVTCGRYHSVVLVDTTSPSHVIRHIQRPSFELTQHSSSEGAVLFKFEDQETLCANIDILSAKCDYFAAMFRCGMRESIERVVEVPDCAKAMFLNVLEFLHFDDFRIRNVDDVVELWRLADMYQLEGLKYCCMNKLESSLNDDGFDMLLFLEQLENLSCQYDELKQILEQGGYKISKSY